MRRIATLVASAAVAAEAVAHAEMDWPGMIAVLPVAADMPRIAVVAEWGFRTLAATGAQGYSVLHAVAVGMAVAAVVLRARKPAVSSPREAENSSNTCASCLRSS